MASIAREWSPKGFALSCVLAGFALCLRTDNQLLRSFGLNGVAGVFAVSLLIGVVALCFVVLVSAHDEERRRWSVGVGLIAGVGGVGFALLQGALPFWVSAAGSGGLLGFSLTCLLRQWGRWYRSLSFQGTLFGTAVSFLVASCLWYAVMHAGTPFLFCLGLLVLVLCGGLPLLMSEIVHADEVRAGILPETVERWEPLVTIWQVVRSGWAAVVGLMISLFAAGLSFWPAVTGPLARTVSFKPLAYAIVVAMVWWVVARARSVQGGVFEGFYRVLLPAAAVVMLAGLFAESGVPLGGSMAFPVASYLGVAVFNVLGLAILFWMAKSSEVGFSKVFALFCGSCTVSFGAGMLAFEVLGWDARTAMLCLLAAYLAAMMLGEARAALLRYRARRRADDVLPDVFNGGE